MSVVGMVAGCWARGCRLESLVCSECLCVVVFDGMDKLMVV